MPTAPPLGWPHAVARTWLWGWGAAVQLITDLLLAAIYLTISSLLITAVVLVPVFAIGVPLLIPTLWLGRVLAHFERLRLFALVGTRVPAPAPSAMTAMNAPWWRRWMLDPSDWRAQGHLALIALWGVVGGSVILALLGTGVALFAVPGYATWLPDDGLAVPVIGSVAASPLVWLLGAALLLVSPLVARVFVGVDVALADWLIGQGGRQQVAALTERVHTLTETRAGAVEVAETERRRIERDLHDGPQQRLVAIAMDLGMARAKLDTGDAEDAAAVRPLIDRAHAASKEAIIELRQVVRGIHPPVLTDRGLDAALSALAARSPVPVQVDVTLPRRPDATVEAIAYFCVSEALTNIAKHARAQTARVQAGTVGSAAGAEVLRIVVSDDGVGGADPAMGTGLGGLRQRLAAVDGTLVVESPPGRGTRLVMELPMGGVS